jgi:hypothetical protein
MLNEGVSYPREKIVTAAACKLIKANMLIEIMMLSEKYISYNCCTAALHAAEPIVRAHSPAALPSKFGCLPSNRSTRRYEGINE